MEDQKVKDGFFVSFCGLDGSGKTTQAKLLCNYIEEHYKESPVYLPGYKPSKYWANLKNVAEKMGETAEHIFSPELISMGLLCDLWENTKRIIIPALKNRKIVITERYWESSLIYSPLLGKYNELIPHCVAKFPIPDVFFFLELSSQTANHRVNIRSQKENKDLAAKESFQIMEKAEMQYNKLLKQYNSVTFRSEEIIVEKLSEEICRSFDEQYEMVLKR